jgi:hypothetical protein
VKPENKSEEAMGSRDRLFNSQRKTKPAVRKQTRTARTRIPQSASISAKAQNVTPEFDGSSTNFGGEVPDERSVLDAYICSPEKVAHARRLAEESISQWDGSSFRERVNQLVADITNGASDVPDDGRDVQASIEHAIRSGLTQALTRSIIVAINPKGE